MLPLLKEECKNIEGIIDALFSKGHLTTTQKEKLNSLTTSDDKIRTIVLNCLMRGSIERFKDFIEILGRDNYHLAETIQTQLERLTEGMCMSYSKLLVSNCAHIHRVCVTRTFIFIR